jgi:hypothetical protein
MQAQALPIAKGRCPTTSENFSTVPTYEELAAMQLECTANIPSNRSKK